MTTAAEFFKALYRNAQGFAELRLLPEGGGIPKRVYRPVEYMAQGDFTALDALNTEYHIYHRVNVSSTKDSKKRNISQVVALYVDIDDASDESYQRLENMALPPTAIIFSGGGFHGYWMLRKPLPIRVPDNIADVERTMQGLQVAYGDGADAAAKDITRILRTPGFKNIKAKYGDDKPVCEIVYLDDDSFGRYNFHELYKQYAPLGAPPQPKITRTIPKEAISKSVPNRVKNYIQHGASVGNRNHELFYCARAYNDAGYSESEALADLGSVARADGLPDDEIKTCIRSAYAYAANPLTTIPPHMRSVMAVEDGVR